MDIALFIILMIALFVVAMFVIPQWRMKRAAYQLIQIFRNYDAVGIKKAKTLVELGLKRPAFLGLTRTGGRDYKWLTLNALIQTGIIEKTDDDRLYLSEEKLFASKLYTSQLSKGKSL